MTPIQVQSTAGPHPLASSQPPAPMAPMVMPGPSGLGRVNAPLACTAAAALAPPSVTAASLDTEPSGRPGATLPGLPTSPDSSSSASGSVSAAKLDKDGKVNLWVGWGGMGLWGHSQGGLLTPAHGGASPSGPSSHLLPILNSSRVLSFASC